MIFVLYFMVLLVSLKGLQGRDAWIFAGLFLFLGWIASKIDERSANDRDEREKEMLNLLRQIKAQHER